MTRKRRIKAIGPRSVRVSDKRSIDALSHIISFLEHSTNEIEVEESDDEERDEDGLPIKCPVCRETFTEPVVTKCRHYFCESCALKQYRLSPECPVCHEPTNGLFLPAKEITTKLKKLKEQFGTNAGSVMKQAEDDDEESS